MLHVGAIKKVRQAVDGLADNQAARIIGVRLLNFIAIRPVFFTRIRLRGIPTCSRKGNRTLGNGRIYRVADPFRAVANDFHRNLGGIGHLDEFVQGKLRTARPVLDDIARKQIALQFHFVRSAVVHDVKAMRAEAREINLVVKRDNVILGSQLDRLRYWLEGFVARHFEGAFLDIGVHRLVLDELGRSDFGGRVLQIIVDRVGDIVAGSPLGVIRGRSYRILFRQEGNSLARKALVVVPATKRIALTRCSRHRAIVDGLICDTFHVVDLGAAVLFERNVRSTCNPLGVENVLALVDVYAHRRSRSVHRTRSVFRGRPSCELHARARGFEVQIIRRLEDHLVVVGDIRGREAHSRADAGIVGKRCVRRRLPPLGIQRDVLRPKLHHAAGIIRSAGAVLPGIPAEERLVVRRSGERVLSNLREASLGVRTSIHRHLARATVRIVCQRAHLIVNIVRVQLGIAVDLRVEIERQVRVVAIRAGARHPAHPLVPFGHVGNIRRHVGSGSTVLDIAALSNRRAGIVFIIGNLVRWKSPLCIQHEIARRHRGIGEIEFRPLSKRRRRVPTLKRRAFGNAGIVCIRRNRLIGDRRTVLDWIARVDGLLVIEGDGVRLPLEVMTSSPNFPDLEETFVTRKIRTHPLESIERIQIVGNGRMHTRSIEHKRVLKLEHTDIIIVRVFIPFFIARVVRIVNFDVFCIPDLFNF